MRKLILLCLITLTTSAAFAQNKPATGKVSGKLLDEKAQPLPFATVMLLKAKDSIIVKSSLGSDAGIFLFDQLPENDYLISISHMGYQKYVSPKFTISANNPSITLPHISLTPQSKSLQGVTITATKPLIEMQADKLVMNVQSSIAATGNTVFELLQKAPGVVAIDQNDNIMLNGKSGIMIYMDGKQTYMSPSDFTNLLKNMRSDQIDKLEIIANPSARYDAAGKAIINIVSIKNKNFGTNGSISTVAGLILHQLSR
ncbi:MAG: carboxypeptidase regulatory-like domain-containing protein [Bacteroidota bacterium]